MTSILFLGGTGFIGRNIIEDLAREEVQIFVLTRNLTDVDPNLLNNSKVNIIQGHLSNLELIKDIISNFEIKIVTHLVSSLIPSSNENDFNYELINTIIPTFNLLDHLSEKGIKVIFFSSGGTIYGDSKYARKETDELAPINYYGYSKLMIENYIQFKNRTKKLNYLILRLSNVFGRYQRVDGKQGFISTAIKKIMEGKSLEIWGNGDTVRDYILVSDVAKIFKMLCENKIDNEVINIGSGHGVRLLDVVSSIENEIGIKVKLEFKDKRSVDVSSICLDIGKLKSLVKFTPTDLGAAIKIYYKEFKL